MKPRTICKLIGHIVKFYDAQYPICERCGAHGYYDGDEYDNEWHYWPIRVWWWLIDLRRLPRKIKRWWQHRQLRDEEIPF